MSDFGLTEYGLQIPSYEDWRNLYYDKARTTFGTELNVGNSSVTGQLLSIFAYQDMLLWEALQAVYNSQTYDGAEGIYLDEILSRRGIFRKSASPSSGFAFIQTDKNASWTYTVNNTVYFSASNGQNYKVSTETPLRERVAAFKLSSSELTAAGSTVTFTINDVKSGAAKTTIIQTSSANALQTLATFIANAIDSKETGKVFVSGDVLYVGFLQTDKDKPIGLSTATRFYANVSLGTKWSLVPVVATVTGINPTYVGEITGMTPTPPAGYISVGNFTEFYAGREVETDAEYRVRFNDTVDEANAATRPAIYKAISDLEGVQRVRIYDNPTSKDTAAAPSFTFNTVVLGGETQAIAETLYAKKPINTLTSGTVSYTITIADGSTEIIRYTPAEQTEYSVRITYRTVNDQALTDDEITAIRANFQVLAASFNIGSTVFNAQLQGVIFNSVPYGRLISLKVETKLVTAPDSAYSSNDITSGFAGIPVISPDNITFSQQV